MLYMTLTHATYSGKLSLIQNHYPILRQWAEYLVNETLYPIIQAVSDGFISERAHCSNADTICLGHLIVYRRLQGESGKPHVPCCQGCRRARLHGLDRQSGR